ncbi:hypothetical protein QVG61_12430 [Thiohalobacter sp. IOR34]|uniref:hypothetical protein n=1 Tax=Thiohalobacter sp. IOR34 TaxID=3057176 RepID=UPI0025B23BE7|nr:hypothetical protein [Thiohalobacter sp. IOR34]WJW75280.1 hypothetical protein QVG61_12430 [Thiohalobacter sp. IOR34]
MPDRSISDEHLNAFVDGQLDSEEKDRILGAINGDPALSRRACELRRLHELVQHAYEHPPQPAGRRRRSGPQRRNPWSQALAASLLLTLGGLIGWIGHGQTQADPAQQTTAMYLDEEKAFQTASIAQAPLGKDGRKILLHISSGDPVAIEAALDKAEQLLRSYRARKQPVELELVANAGGLNPLRADVSPFADRVHALQQEFENLTFLACQTAMNRLLAREGIQELPPLLPEALVTPNALEEILSRLQEGWVYLSI